jgi:hypothetical protein
MPTVERRAKLMSAANNAVARDVFASYATWNHASILYVKMVSMMNVIFVCDEIDVTIVVCVRRVDD